MSKDIPLGDEKRDIDAPPAYDENGANIDLQLAFRNLVVEDPKDGPAPNACIAHLKLLEALYLLREDISTQERLFGIQNPPRGSDDQRNKTIEEQVKEKRWSVFVTQAAMRFQIWWERILQPKSHMLTQAALQKQPSASHWTSIKTAQAKQPGAPERGILYLPPLDVLMVWHAFMLNPRNYLSDCLRFGKMDTWVTGMPWQAVSDAIDPETFQYSPSPAHRGAWESVTGLAWEPDTVTEHVSLPCMFCSRTNSVPWTTMFQHGKYSAQDAKGEGNGYADPDLWFRCQCDYVSTHESARVLHFWQDLDKLLRDDVVMPGTFLHLKGYMLQPTKPGTSDLGYPNRFLRYSYGNEIIADIKASMSAVVARRGSGQQVVTMDRVRKFIERGLKDPPVPGNRPSRDSRIAIRRMMAAYWDNSSIFSMDLVGAVIRQGTFIKKMHDIDWLHSPSVKSTMNRLISKYFRFFSLICDYPKHVAVPTLDVDLAWHTHQLSPYRYYDYSIQMTNKRRGQRHSGDPDFIDHDDKIADTKLSDAFAWTSKTYFERFGDVYSECTCWYCEAIRESHRPGGIFHREERRRFDEKNERLHEPGSGSDPAKNPHISAHNAITTTDKSTALAHKRIHQAWLVRHAQKAQDRAEKDGRKVGGPSNSPYVDAGGFPYMGVVYTPGIYVAPPGCASYAPGAAGNCCSGTCGGGVAAGACASGACGGGSAGGCGGGGSSGGCGGGGGGGGGGGCGGGGGGCGGGG